MDDTLNYNSKHELSHHESSQNELSHNDDQKDYKLIEQKETDLAYSELDDLAYNINSELQTYIQSTGAPIAQNLRTFDIFAFNIKMLLKYSTN